MNLTENVSNKKIVHHGHLEENNLLFIWPTNHQRKPSWSGLCALMTQEIMPSSDAQWNTKESPKLLNYTSYLDIALKMSIFIF